MFQPSGQSEISARAETHHVIRLLKQLWYLLEHHCFPVMETSLHQENVAYIAPLLGTGTLKVLHRHLCLLADETPCLQTCDIKLKRQ